MPKPLVLNESQFSPEQVQEFMMHGDIDQGSDEWFEERLGKVTASKVRDVVTMSSYGKPYQSYYDYIIQLALERITGAQPRFSNKYMDHGNKYESEAAAMYEEVHPEADVRECGFVEHPTLALGASPDRLVDEDGTIEIKAPNSSTLVRYMVSMIPETDSNHELVKMLGLKGNEWKYYYEQIQLQLLVTNRQWCDFTVYDPDLPENVQLVVKRVPRDDTYINELMLPRITEFLDKVNKLESYLRNL